MNELDIRSYRDPDREAEVQLWLDCGLVMPWNDPATDIRRNLRV